MDDAISRQAVLDIINFEDNWLFDAKSHNTDTKIAFSTIKLKISDLPSVTPTRPTAQWERFAGDFIKCSKCGELTKFYFHYKYCPNCGAKMGVEDEADN